MGFAGGVREGDPAGLGDELLAGLGAFQDRAGFADDLAEADLADARHGGQQRLVGVRPDRVGKRLVQLADGGVYRAHQLDLDADEYGDGCLAEAACGGRGGAHPLDEHLAGRLAGVTAPFARRLQLAGGELGGGLRLDAVGAPAGGGLQFQGPGVGGCDAPRRRPRSVPTRCCAFWAASLSRRLNRAAWASFQRGCLAQEH
ncbi:hypothetical protein [Kitasatospora indigofera]|uniref:hypothetical protein n=1 Tax=Kitasatospora indigofera TaxID=67307 RepID=UPI0033A86DFA